MFPILLGKNNDLEKRVKVLEDSGGGVLVVTDTEGTLDKTWQEIFNADFAILSYVDSDLQERSTLIVTTAYLDNEIYYVIGDATMPLTYTTNSANGYPVRQAGQ